jgi:LacI family transcriptional regulator
MPLTLEDIAQISGYSRSTVSRVVNGDSAVSDKTRKQVMEVLHRFDFQPNMAARGLALGKTRVLGLVIPMGVRAIFADPFFPLVIQGVSTNCNTRNYSVMLWLAEPEYERRTITKILYNGLIDGVIVASMLLDDPIVESLVLSKLPFVLIGRHPVHEHISYVDVDNKIGSRQAILHLLRLGRRRIATITGPQNMIAGMDRYQGYLDVMHERGILPNPELVMEGDFSDAGGYAAMQRLLQYKPDAVFAASDIMALGAIRAAHDAGLRIPQDIAIVGFDDIPMASQSIPLLTTIRQPIVRSGFIAADILIDLVENSPETPQQIILPTELVIRESCGSNL